MHGGDRVAEVLLRHGVEQLFTLCGGHISPILVGAKARGIRVVDTRHEVNAVFAADAVARLTGIPGVAAVTAGPGCTNTITAVKNAQQAQSPVIVLGGAAATVLRGRGSLQDIDQAALMRPHVKKVLQAKRVSDLAPMVATAFELSREDVPGPVFVECPIDLLYDESLVRDWYGAKSAGKSLAEKAEKAYLRWHLARMFDDAGDVNAHAETAVPERPASGDVSQALALLDHAERPVLVVGSQTVLDAAHADEVAAALARLGAPVYLSGMARGLLGARHPLLRRHKRREALREADLVVLCGVPADFRLDYGRHIRRTTPVIGVNRSRADLRRNRRPTLGVLGDPGLFLRALAELTPASAPSRWEAWHSTLSTRDAEREREIDASAAAPATGGVNPVALCREIEKAMSPDATIIADGGDFVGTASYTLNPRAPLTWLDPGVFGTLGVGAGFALGASLVRPGSETWVIFGDGSFGYSLAEFDTFTRHGVAPIAVVGNDGAWAQIARDQIEILKDDVGTVLRRADYDRAAEGLGAKGLRLDDLANAPAIFAEAKAVAKSGRAVVINALLGKSDFRKGSISM